MANPTRLKGRWAVRLPTWLGDTVMALPTVRTLASAADELVVQGSPNVAGLLRASGLSPFLPYRRRPGPAGLADFARGVGALRSAAPDGVLLLPNAFEAALLARLAGIPRRVGYRTDGRGSLLTDAVEPPPPWRTLHDADRYGELLGAVGVEPSSPPPAAPAVSREAREWAAARLDGGSSWLALVPGAANGPAKRWPAERYGALADGAAAGLGARPLLLGGRDDLPVGRAVAAASETGCLDLVGQGDVEELAALLLRSRVVVSNDTGAAHLAAALGRPTVVPFGPTDPQKTAPRGPAVRIVQAGVVCQPCRCQVCPLDHSCMTRLSVETILQAVEELWRDGPAVDGDGLAG